MQEQINLMLGKMELNGPADVDLIARVEESFNISFPPEYKDFMQLHDGGTGLVGNYGYLMLWSIGDIVELNFSANTPEFAPELILFASDGSGTTYAFDKSSNLSIVEFFTEEISAENTRKCSDTFWEFITYLYQQEELL